MSRGQRSDDGNAEVHQSESTPGRWVPLLAYVVLGASVAFLVSFDMQTDGSTHAALGWVPAAVLGAAVAVSRFRPAWGLALLVGAAAARIALGVEGASEIVGLIIVTFQCGRRGGRATVWLAGIYIVLAYLSGGLYAVSSGTHLADALMEQGASYLSAFLLTTVGTIAPLCMPMLLGFALRMREGARVNRERQLRAEADRNMSEALREIAEDVARAESEKAALARDVHDVVGHSLAVILAQAESGLFLREDTPDKVQGVLRTIADSARSSLDDVRGVLQPSRAPRPTSDLDGLLTALPASIDLKDVTHGTPVPLNPALAVVARRTLQEMLTNALKHGSSGPITVTRDWTAGLRIAVTNPAESGPRGHGLGLDGMRRRVENAGGKLVVDDQGTTYSVEAHLPRVSDLG